MKKHVVFPVVFTIISGVYLMLATTASGGTEQKALPANISSQTRSCLGCHTTFTPGIVHDWLASRHARTTIADALAKPEIERRLSTAAAPGGMAADVVIGCYECHSRNPEKHTDNFVHFGHRINVVVSPPDCAGCHPEEAAQFAGSKKAEAHKNLMGNPLYHSLAATITGRRSYEKGTFTVKPPSESTLHETCLGCHGTKVSVRGWKKLKTKMGEVEITVPDLTNWPNQGVGRENPDGSVGACTACHPRHAFSIEVARKPYTCGQCHEEPDVPAWNVYKVSKHGNIYASQYHGYNFDAVPWVAGRDFTAPTCATCHNSLIANPDGKVVASRTHDFGGRLWVRLFGLPYAHRQPKKGDTSVIRNKDGLPLPTTFVNEPAEAYLIDDATAEKRFFIMKGVCGSCHSGDWVNGHFSKLDATIRETNEMTLTATKIVLDAWESGVEDKTNPFDESIEQRWLMHWLFFGNSIRYASAMTGAPDYTSFKLGWWEYLKNLTEMHETLAVKKALRKPAATGR